MFTKIKNVILDIAKSFGTFLTPTNVSNSLTNATAKGTQRRLSRDMGEVESKLKNVGKNVVTFSDPMTGCNYEVHRMLETGGDLHIANADTRMASVLDSKALKKVAKKRSAMSSYIQDRNSTSISTIKKSFDKKHGVLSIEEQDSKAEILVGGRTHEKRFSNSVNLSLDEVSTYRSDSEVFKQKNRQKDSTSSRTFSSYETMSKDRVTIEKSKEERHEQQNKSTYSLASLTVGSRQIWDQDSYTQSSTREGIVATENRKQCFNEFTSYFNEHRESVSSNGFFTVSEENRNLKCIIDKNVAKQILYKNVVQNILDVEKNVLTVSTENCSTVTCERKNGHTIDSYDIRQSVSSSGIASLDWNFGHYSETESAIEKSLFSATGCWQNADDFQFELTYETSFKDKRRGTEMSSIATFEGDSWNEFVDVTQSLNIRKSLNIRDVPLCGVPTLTKKFSKN